jgi:hypothetical protein
MTQSAARFLLHLGRVEERSHDRGGADAHRDARFHQFCPAFLGRFVDLIAHDRTFMAFGHALEAA